MVHGRMPLLRVMEGVWLEADGGRRELFVR